MGVRRLWQAALAGALAVPLVLPAVTSPATTVPTTIDAAPVANVSGATPLSANATPMWQTNGTVWSMAYSAGKLYIAGNFTKARPPGVAPGGAGEVTVKNLIAINTTTGNYISTFKHTANKIVYALSVSPDGRTLYAGGDFTTVDGQARSQVASFDLTKTAAPLTTFAPAMSGQRVRALSASNTAVYLAGAFTSAGSLPRTGAAAFTSTGTLLPWAPQLDKSAGQAIVVLPDDDRVYIGGNFSTVNGQLHRALALVDATNGANLPQQEKIFPEDCSVTACASFSTVKALIYANGYVYAGAEGSGYGWFDGTIKLNPTDGTVEWKDNCLGATQAVTVVDTTLYAGSHAHDCSDVEGGFPQPPLQKGWHHLIAEDVDTGIVQPWFPNTNAGPNVDPLNELGPRAMATDGRQVFVGGSFTTVNDKPQQSLTRFAARTATAKGAVPVAPIAPVAASNGKGTILVKFAGSYDLDDGQLTYRLYRDNTLIRTWTNAKARKWFVPQFAHTDKINGTHNYTVTATDAAGQTSPRSPVGTATAISAVSNGGYPAAVKAQNPAFYWQFEEAAGATKVTDAGINGVTGTPQRGVTFGAEGVTPGTRAVNVQDAVISVDKPAAPIPNTFAMEVWFKTTSNTGGRLVGYGDSNSGTSNQYDPFLYMDAGGQLIFGVWNNRDTFEYNGIWGAKAYNDGTWHHAVAQQFPTATGTWIDLYVDGVRQGGGRPGPKAAKTWSGFPRVGTDSFGSTMFDSWPLPPATAGFTGTLDDVAFYNTKMTAGQVLNHYRRAG
jgi:hypothetical protein